MRNNFIITVIESIIIINSIEVVPFNCIGSKLGSRLRMARNSSVRVAIAEGRSLITEFIQMFDREYYLYLTDYWASTRVYLVLTPSHFLACNANEHYYQGSFCLIE
jgi:hypothetical protein